MCSTEDVESNRRQAHCCWDACVYMFFFFVCVCARVCTASSFPCSKHVYVRKSLFLVKRGVAQFALRGRNLLSSWHVSQIGLRVISLQTNNTKQKSFVRPPLPIILLYPTLACVPLFLLLLFRNLIIFFFANARVCCSTGGMVPATTEGLASTAGLHQPGIGARFSPRNLLRPFSILPASTGSTAGGAAAWATRRP